MNWTAADKTINQLLTTFPKGAILALEGAMGVGKTTFVRQWIHRLSPQERVMSPSFTYQIEYPHLTPPIFHWDLYRLEKADGKILTELGFFDAIAKSRSSNGFLLIEWASRAEPKLIPLNGVLQFEFLKEGRGIQFKKLP